MLLSSVEHALASCPCSPVPISRKTKLVFATNLFGTNASWMLLAFILTETYTYYQHSKTDRQLLKLMVYGTVCLQIAETALDSLVTYRFVVRDSGDPGALFDGVASVVSDTQPVLDAISGFVVQCFFTRRIWVFVAAVSGPRVKLFTKFVCAFIVLMGIGSLGSVLTFFIGEFSDASGGTDFPEWIVDMLVVWTISGAVADVTITVCMMSILYHAKSSSYFGETRDRISKVIRLTIQTGFLTSVLALLVPPLLLRHVFGFYGLPFFLLGKSYVISLLVNLNARTRKDMNANIAVEALQLSTIAFSPAQRRNPESERNTSGQGISGFLRSLGTVTQRRSAVISTDLENRSESDHVIPSIGTLPLTKSRSSSHDQTPTQIIHSET